MVLPPQCAPCISMAARLLRYFDRPMKLRTKLLLASSAIVLVVLAVSEWFGYHLTSLFLTTHEAKMASELSHGSHGAALAELQQGSHALFVRLAALHFFHAAFTVLALILALNALWNRTVLRPLADLLRHISYMRRGTWKTPVPVHSRDEIGELTEAFNELGGQLTLTVQQFGSASKLSAMALLGQSMVRRVLSATEILRTAMEAADMNNCTAGVNWRPEQARLQLVLKLLDEIPEQLEKEFQRELEQHSHRAAPQDGAPRQPENDQPSWLPGNVGVSPLTDTRPLLSPRNDPPKSAPLRTEPDPGSVFPYREEAS
jgi:HAMP domain-containing protein